MSEIKRFAHGSLSPFSGREVMKVFSGCSRQGMSSDGVDVGGIF